MTFIVYSCGNVFTIVPTGEQPADGYVWVNECTTANADYLQHPDTLPQGATVV